MEQDSEKRKSLSDEKANKDTIVTLNGHDVVVLPLSESRNVLSSEAPQLQAADTTSQQATPLKSNHSDLNLIENGHKQLNDLEAGNTSSDLLEPKELSEEENEEETKCSRFIGAVHSGINGFVNRHGTKIKNVLTVLLLIGFVIYFSYACYFDHPELTPLIGVTVFIVVAVSLSFISRRWGGNIDACFCAHLRKLHSTKFLKFLEWLFYVVVVSGITAFVVLDVGWDVHRLSSLGGMFFFIIGGFLTSKYPSKIKWRPVLWGLGLQLTLAVLILRWTPGFIFFDFLGNTTKTFLHYADHGSMFVFGEQGLIDHPMAFQIFPIIIYFSAVINIFYYWGAMQFVICKIAWLMQFTMGTTAIESLNAACNIFVGMAESCIIMKPFLGKLTKSELHAVMTGGFATVAGSYIALLVSMGASAQHLISAAIMSAPAALAMAKLNYPETEESHTKTEGDVQLEKAPEKNLIQAASNGAMSALGVVASVAANLIAILGLIAFVDAVLGYLGSLVGVPTLSFETICGTCFWPLAMIMGVEVNDSRNVGSLLGTKLFVDEFISFQNLIKMVNNSTISKRSAVLGTYACCGFGSIAAMGVYIGALTTVAPSRKDDITQLAFRAMLNGNVAGFLTACIAGVLFNEDSFNFN